MNIFEGMIGKYCIVRCSRAGVFAGVVKAINGSEAILTDCRRIWYWCGAASLSQLATDGTKKENDCKFTVAVQEIGLTDAIEYIPCTERAESCIRSVPEWKM